LLLPLQVKDQDLVSPALAQSLGCHLRAGRLDHGSRLARNRQHVAEFDGLVFGRYTLNLHHVAWCDPILLTTGTNNRVHKPSIAGRLGRCAPKISNSGKPRIARAETSAPWYAQAPHVLGERLAPRRQAGIAKLE